MKLKRIFIILIFCLTALINVSSAAGDNIAINSISGNRGDNVALTVSTDTSLGFVAAQIIVKYDADKLEYISSKAGEMLSMGMAMTSNRNGEVNLIYAGNAITNAGDLMEVTFKIKDNASGSVPLKLEVAELKKEGGGNIEHNIRNGNIIVLGTESEKTPVAVEKDKTENTANTNNTSMSANANVVNTTQSTGEILSTNSQNDVEKTENKLEYKINNASNNGLISINRENGIIKAMYNVQEAGELNNVAWTSSNTDVATVDEAGNITLVGNGIATISLMSGEELKDNIEIEVLPETVQEEAKKSNSSTIVVFLAIISSVMIAIVLYLRRKEGYL